MMTRLDTTQPDGLYESFEDLAKEIRELKRVVNELIDTVELLQPQVEIDNR